MREWRRDVTKLLSGSGAARDNQWKPYSGHRCFGFASSHARLGAGDEEVDIAVEVTAGSGARFVER